MANIYENIIEDKDKAKEIYKKLMFEYPGSIYVVEARKNYRILRGDNMTKEEKFFRGIID